MVDSHSRFTSANLITLTFWPIFTCLRDNILSANSQRKHGAYGGLFEGIDGTGVFFGVGEAAVSEDAGYGLDVGSVAQ